MSATHHVTAIAANPVHNLDFYTRTRDGASARLLPRETGGKADDLVGLNYGIAPGAALRSRPGEVLENDGAPVQRVWHAASRGGQALSA